MARRTTAPLRVIPQTLEPDPALLHQLAQLGASSAPAARTARHAAVRSLVVATTVAAIAGTTWVAGALPGPEFPLGPAEQPTHEPTDVSSPGGDDVRAPQPDEAHSSASGSPGSPGLPGRETATEPTEEAGEVDLPVESDAQPPLQTSDDDRDPLAEPGTGEDRGAGEDGDRGDGFADDDRDHEGRDDRDDRDDHDDRHDDDHDGDRDDDHYHDDDHGDDDDDHGDDDHDGDRWHHDDRSGEVHLQI